MWKFRFVRWTTKEMGCKYFKSQTDRGGKHLYLWRGWVIWWVLTRSPTRLSPWPPRWQLYQEYQKHDPKAANALTADTVDALVKAHPLKQSISKSKRKMIQSIAKRKDLMVLPADKGTAAVIVDTEEYIDKIGMMLNDEKARSWRETWHMDTMKNWWPALQAWKMSIRSLRASIETCIPHLT